MGLRLENTEISLFRGMILVTLYLQPYINSDYNWPSDYLTRNSDCYLSSQSWFQFNMVCDNACDLSRIDKLPNFDFIVVGSGPAGSVIANRLATKNDQWKVLLIEAGDVPLLETTVPALFSFNFNTSVSFNYFEESSPNYANAFKSGSTCYSGKTLGGSTAINAMIYHCGCDEDYNAWATASGDSSWNYQNFLPYLMKPQDVQDSSRSFFDGKCESYQGKSGPVVLNNMHIESDTISPLIRDAVKELGYPFKSNLNCGPPFTGFGNIPMSINNGRRQCAARSYILPMTRQKNLYLMLNSFVSKVTTMQDSSGAWIATGVTVVTNIPHCSTINIRASREVIISAGARHSPLILLRSGIGRAADLQTCGIQQISDVPSGKNLVDHIAAYPYFSMPGLGKSATENSAYFAGQSAQYLSNFKGLFSRISGMNIMGFINTLKFSANCPNMQYMIVMYDQNLVDFDLLVSKKFGYKPEFAQQLIDINKYHSLLEIDTIVLKTKSSGEIKLGSCSDPFANPIIKGNQFSDPTDLNTLVQGLMFLCKLFNTTAAIEAGIKPIKFDIPECNSLDVCTEAYFRCYTKYFTKNFWHPTGTCRMGISSDNAVVDSKLKVFGVNKLRVADASIMPEIIAGNTQCPTYAIGEKAADMIISENI